MEWISVRIEKPGAINFTLRQTHFIKTVEDLHEATEYRGRCENRVAQGVAAPDRLQAVKAREFRRRLTRQRHAFSPSASLE